VRAEDLIFENLDMPPSHGALLQLLLELVVESSMWTKGMLRPETFTEAQALEILCNARLVLKVNDDPPTYKVVDGRT
jgi:hypothetical protein